MNLILLALAFSWVMYLVGYITALREYGVQRTKTQVLRQITDGAGVAMLLVLMAVPMVLLTIANRFQKEE